MNKRIFLPIFAITLVFSALAAAETKDAKAPSSTKPTTLEELNFKYDRLMQLDFARHQEILKELKEIRALESKKAAAPTVESTPSAAKPVEPVTASTTATESSTATAAPSATAAQAPASTPVPATTEEAPPIIPPQVPEEKPATAVQPQAAVVTPAVVAASEPAAGKEATPDADATGRASTVAAVPAQEPASPAAAPATASTTAQVPATAPQPAATPQATAPVSVSPVSASEDLSQGMHQSQSLSILAIMVSLISLVSMGVLIFTIRKSDERMRRMLWKSEVDHLRDEVMGGRPSLKVEKSYDRLLLTNTGSVVADDIKLSLGPAPGTMKQRLRVLAQIAANEKAEVEIGPQPSGGQIYGTLEYKNPDNGRIYKDQFMLKVDGVTGELIPVQQAS